MEERLISISLYFIYKSVHYKLKKSDHFQECSLNVYYI